MVQRSQVGQVDGGEPSVTKPGRSISASRVGEMSGYRKTQAQAKADECELRLTGRFELTLHGEPVTVGRSGERLLAYLALAGRAMGRHRVAGDLWGDSSEPQAGTNLRTALWRLPKSGQGLVSRHGSRLGIASGLRVDVAEMTAHAEALRTSPTHDVPIGRIAQLTELLPGWNDTWIVVERERLRLLCLAALESAAASCAREGRPAKSLEFAIAAARIEPLRETAWRLVVEAHRDQGNLADAFASYTEYCGLLRREIGIGPSVLMMQLIATCGIHPVP